MRDGHPCVYPPTLRILVINPSIIRAADFNCRLPVNTSPVKIFVLTFIGVFIPTVLLTVLGALLMTVPEYVLAYESGDATGVLSKGAVCCSRQANNRIDALSQVFEHWGHGGDFILVFLALSATMNIST